MLSVSVGYVSQHIVPSAVRQGRLFRICGRTSDEHCALHTTTVVFRYCCRRLGTALTPVSSTRAFKQTGLCSCSYHCSIFNEKWRRGLAAFVIADESHYVDFTTTSNKLCHSLDGCNCITFPRTSRLMYRLISACIMGVDGLHSDNGCLFLITCYTISHCLQAQVLSHVWGYPSHHYLCNAQLTRESECVVYVVKVFVAMSAVTLTTILESLARRVVPDT